ncbi:DUF3147 family protein [Planotetraspora phitsanulokensis]|uniref:DUF3147 family protein n=1 Tax=Planotetraspora phitsanulokensis TaxID=575192 RepID=A0A8J3XIL4_9ACTN|nr:DUF3147 family protein [Planotetraspora phitsanulokensis]GII42484.1 hypothetical protein Pph01_74870 [Planotetraspora phitsanulokensis]
MARQIVEVALKALAGGLFVLGFAVLAEMMTPKRLAGVFSAGPSVALGSLLVTAALIGQADMRAAADGMRAGAIAFFVYCLVVPPLLKAWGVWRAALAGLTVWVVTAGAAFLLLPQS